MDAFGAETTTDEVLDGVDLASLDSVTWKSVPAGAATSVWAAVVAGADEIGGRYCEDCHVAEPAEPGGSDGVQGYALDPDTATKLWALSEQMVGETFPAP